MSIIRTFGALGSAVFAILAAYAIGHGISEGHLMPYVFGGIAALASFVLGFLQVKFGGSGEPSH